MKNVNKNHENENHVGSLYVGTDGNIVSIVCRGCDRVIQVTNDDILDKKKLIPHVKCPICSSDIQLCERARGELLKNMEG